MRKVKMKIEISKNPFISNEETEKEFEIFFNKF